MSQQLGLSRFRGLFDVALQDYEKMTNITLVKHPLAEKLYDCHSAESITHFFRDRALEFGDFPGGDNMMKSITNIASTLCTLSATAVLGDATNLVSSGSSWGHSASDTSSTVIPACKGNTNWPRHPNCRTCTAFLHTNMCNPSHIQVLQAAKGVNTRRDELVALFESIEQLLKPLGIYTQLPPPPVEEMLVKIMAELLSTLALMTKELQEGRSSEPFPVGILPSLSEKQRDS
jgi:hypothetical protein